MREITETQTVTSQVKRYRTQADEFALVHTANRVLLRVGPNAGLSTAAANKLLVGTQKEIDAEVEELRMPQ